MGLLARRREKKADREAQREAQAAALELAPRLEQAIMTLAVHSQEVDDRLRSLEERIMNTDSKLEQLPTQADVLAVRVHSAQVLTELAAVSLDLRAEMGRLRDEQRGSKMIVETESINVIRLETEDDEDEGQVVDLRSEPTPFMRPDAPEFMESTNVEADAITWAPHHR